MGGPRALALAFPEVEKLRRTNAGQQRKHCTTNTATTSSSSNTTTSNTTTSSNSAVPQQSPQIAKLRGVKLGHNWQGHKKATFTYTHVHIFSTHSHPSFNLALYTLFLFRGGKRASVRVPGQGCFLHCCSEAGRLVK